MAAPPIEFLNSYFWMFLATAVAVAAVAGFLIFWFVVVPKISREFTKARFSKGPVALIQDDSNTVHLVTSDIALPEGVIHTKRGWFLQSRAPYITFDKEREQTRQEVEQKLYAELKEQHPDLSDKALMVQIEEQLKSLGYSKRGRGRPSTKDTNGEVNDRGLTVHQESGLSTILQAPILAGFNRAVFFGYDGAPLLSNLKTIALANGNVVEVTKTPVEENGKKGWSTEIKKLAAHADMRVLKEIIPATISRSQLGALCKYAELKGFLKSKSEQTRLIFFALIIIGVLGSLGIVGYMLLQA